jgi:hypothetical protein
MTTREFTATPEWVREGPGSGVPSGFQEEMQLTGHINIGGSSSSLQVVIRSQERNLLNLDENKNYKITIEEVAS